MSKTDVQWQTLWNSATKFEYVSVCEWNEIWWTGHKRFGFQKRLWKQKNKNFSNYGKPEKLNKSQMEAMWIVIELQLLLLLWFVYVCFFFMTVFDYTTVTTNGCRIHSFVLPFDALTHLHNLTHFHWEFDASQTLASQIVFFVLYYIFHSVTIL